MTDLSRVARYPERTTADRTALDGLLDSELVGTLSTVVDGEPWSVPLLFARDGDRVLLHGSTGAGLLRHVAAGAPVTFTVTVLDAVVVAHTAFDSSANYRSAVIRGRCTPVEADAAVAALDLFTEKVIPGRTAEVRPSNRRELAATLVLALPLDEYVYKSRTGAAGAPDEETDAWYGTVPMRRVAGAPVADDGCEAPLPASVQRLAGD